MDDGVRLAARIWMPVAAAGSYPAILEFIPYRKQDLVRARDERTHPWLAAHGFVCLRVDMRGSGDSEGEMPDMYCDREIEDARQLIEWIAAQPWCSGRVGMFGTSWGGTASLQAAVDAPEPLKAVLANCATWDRFEDDIHWMGGCLLTDSFEWGATLPAILACPPDAETVGEDWLGQWRRRLESLSFPLEQWVRHRFRGEYWRRGSVRFASERLGCPVLAIGGWSDRYSNAVMPLVEARSDNCWGIVGPWGHSYPDQGEPGPAAGFQQIALAWWNHWLRNDRPGDLAWPRTRLWLRRFDPPQNRLTRRNGSWAALSGPGGGNGRGMVLDSDNAGAGASADSGWFAVPYDLRHGECAGDTGYFGRHGGLPLDQAADDDRSLRFESEPLESEFKLIGSAKLGARIKRDRQAAQLVCRLCEVDAQGRSNLVVRGILNLALDAMMDGPAPLSAAASEMVWIQLPVTAYRFARGHRIRLAVAASYWPLVFPTARDPGMRLQEGAQLFLPTTNALATDGAGRFPDPLDLPPEKSWTACSEPAMRRTQNGVTAGGAVTAWSQKSAAVRFTKMEKTVSQRTEARFDAAPGDSSGPQCEFGHTIEIERPDGKAVITSRLAASGANDAIKVRGTLKANWNGTALLRRPWGFECELNQTK